VVSLGFLPTGRRGGPTGRMPDLSAWSSSGDGTATGASPTRPNRPKPRSSD